MYIIIATQAIPLEKPQHSNSWLQELTNTSLVLNCILCMWKAYKDWLIPGCW